MKIEFILLMAFSLLLSACVHPEKVRLAGSSDGLSITAVAHPERPKKDVVRDKVRSPETVLKFYDVKQGDKVLEILAAGGYYTELLSRCVGETGNVYMQNNKKYFQFQSDKSVVERLQENRLPNVIRWDKELSDLQFAAGSLDKIFMILVLHDFYWMEKDVNVIIRQALSALKPGGILAVIDHSAKQGTGIQSAIDVKGLHRIDKDYVIKLMLKSGFNLDAESDSLEQLDDDRNRAFFNLSQTGKATDRFMLRFKKPEAT